MRNLTLAALAALSLTAGAASAQSASPMSPNQMTPQGVSDWLAARGVSPELVTGDSEPFLRVQDGQLTWLLFFYGCDASGCDSLQFGAGFTNDTVTLERVNAWNRDRRFLKAYLETGDANSAIVQYDVIPADGAPVGQLADHVDLWRSNLSAFAVHVGYLTPAQ